MSAHDLFTCARSYSDHQLSADGALLFPEDTLSYGLAEILGWPSMSFFLDFLLGQIRSTLSLESTAFLDKPLRNLTSSGSTGI